MVLPYLSEIYTVCKAIVDLVTTLKENEKAATVMSKRVGRIAFTLEQRHDSLKKSASTNDAMKDNMINYLMALRAELLSVQQTLKWYVELGKFSRAFNATEFHNRLTLHDERLTQLVLDLQLAEAANTSSVLDLMTAAKEDQAAALRTVLHHTEAAASAARENNVLLAKVLAKLAEPPLSAPADPVAGSPVALPSAVVSLVPVLRPSHALFEAVKLDEACLGPKGRLLGKGGFGEVRESTCFGVPVAVKYIPHLTSRDLKNVRMEVTTMSRLRHPNVCGCLGVVVAEEYCAIVLELLPASSTLYDKLPEMGWAERVRAALDVARAVAYLHAKQVIHNDLKASNAIVAADGTVKLIDFGLALTKSTLTRVTGLTFAAGTMLWMAPELLRRENRKLAGDVATDVYSLGMVLVELLTGDVPYGSATVPAMARELANLGEPPMYAADPELRLEMHEKAAIEAFKGIIADCVSTEDTARPTAAVVHERLVHVQSITNNKRDAPASIAAPAESASMVPPTAAVARTEPSNAAASATAPASGSPPPQLATPEPRVLRVHGCSDVKAARNILRRQELFNALDFQYVTIGTETIAALKTKLRNVQSIELRDCRCAWRIGQVLADVVVASESCGSLKRLAINNGIKIRSGVHVVARVNALTVPIDDDDLETLAQAGVRLRALEVFRQPVTTVVSMAATLVELHAGENECGISDAGLATAHGIVKLIASNNPKITTVAPFATTLTELDASGSGIDDAGLSSALHIVKLDAANNPRVTTVAPFATTLVELNASGNCGIDDAGLASARGITKFNASGNAKVTTVAPFGTTLVELDASNRPKITNVTLYTGMREGVRACEDCGIGDSGLAIAQGIVKLNASGNPKVTTTAPFAATLVELDASGKCGIDDFGLASARGIKKFNASGNATITTVAPFATTLTELDASGRCGLDDVALASAHGIAKLNAFNNQMITRVAPFALTLTTLNVGGTCGVRDAGLAWARRIVKLDASENSKVTTVAPFATTLTELNASGKCGIDDAGLASARGLVTLHAKDNGNITTVAPFALTLLHLDASGKYCGIGDAGLADARSIITLDAFKNPEITTVAPFAATLLELQAGHFYCGITDAGLASARSIVKLGAMDNRKITTVVPFAATLTHLTAGHQDPVIDTMARVPPQKSSNGGCCICC
jgi:serine/threonine protein kinase